LPDEALVRGDERLLRRVTTNLVDNAVKHGDSRWIGIAARANGSRLVVEVSNTGPKLPIAMRASLFEPFFRGERASVGVPGFGLGLPFARAVARAHGGDIELTETSSEVNVFVWTLPLVAYSGESDGAARNPMEPIQVSTTASTSQPSTEEDRPLGRD
jgi:signal transduction histidine kinase